MESYLRMQTFLLPFCVSVASKANMDVQDLMPVVDYLMEWQGLCHGSMGDGVL